MPSTMDFHGNLGDEIVGTLRQLGLDPAGEHTLQFYFYFPAEAAARALAARLAADGFTCDVDRSAAGGRWLCLAQRAMPADAAALTALGKRFLQLTSELGGAFDGWDRDTAVANEPPSKTLLRHAYQLYQRGAYLRAAELLKKAVDAGGELAPSAATMLGLACFNLAEYEASVAAFKMAAAFNAGDNPSAFAALSGMGASLAKLGRFDEAVKVYQRSIAAKPDFAETHLNLTLAYAELGRTTDVLKTLRTAIALDMRMKDRARQAIELQGLRGNAEFDALVGKG